MQRSGETPWRQLIFRHWSVQSRPREFPLEERRQKTFSTLNCWTWMETFGDCRDSKRLEGPCSIPLLIVIFACLNCALLGSPSFVLFAYFAPRQNVRADQPCLKVSSREVVWCPAKTLEANDAIGHNTIYKSQHAWQYLDVELGNKERAIVHINLQ